MNNSIKQYYKGKKVFVTGHTGFKGSWLIYLLSLLGAKTKGYALPVQSEDDHYAVINGDSMCQSVIGDIRDEDKLQKEIIEFDPDFVFHLAAQSLVKYSYDHPKETYETNVMGTLNVINAVRKVEKKCTVIIITTDKVYHNNEWDYPYRENDRLGGYDPYSSSKACTEVLVDSFRASYFNVSDYDNHQKAISTTRAGNVIGGGDWALNRIVPDIVRSLRSNATISIRSPYSTRPWQHVLEPLDGYLTLGKKLDENCKQFSGAWNFGPKDTMSCNVESLVKNAISVWGHGKYQIEGDQANHHEAGKLNLDISKSRNLLKWNPVWSEDECITKTIEWYRDVVNNDVVPHQKTEQQIQEYLSQV